MQRLNRLGRVRVSIPDDLDVRKIRLSSGYIGATQHNFAEAIGVPG
jgi:hypothetical protein